MARRSTGPPTALILLLAAASLAGAAPKSDPAPPKQADKPNLPAVMWRDPGAVPALDLLYGAGGKDRAPDLERAYTFVKEDPAGNSPKFDVDDDQGVRWKVKLGPEAHSETAATRLLWAAGYFVDEDYELPRFKVAGLPDLTRGDTSVTTRGTVLDARLERRVPDAKRVGRWGWFDNPFVGTAEFNGLRVMMALLNNWDLTDANNSIEEVNGERRYLVSDAGATFGATGNHFTHSKSALQDYVHSKFIENVSGDSVDFVMHSRPFFLMALDVPLYRDRTNMEQITRHVPRRDARQLGDRLSQLSTEQLRDAFRGAGYTPEEVEGYATAVQKRIAALCAL